MRQAWDAPEVEPEIGDTLDFMRELWALHHALEAASKRMEARHGITAQQRMIIRIVGAAPNVTAGRMAEMLRIHPGTLSTALKRLERRRLVTRDADPRDRRRVLLGLTAAGRKYTRPMRETVEGSVGRALKHMPAARIAMAKGVLSLVSGHLLGKPTR
jgi:DNA-binding MarR family transcriptional regulator